MTRREKELVSQLGECREALAQSRRENELLRQKIDLLIRRVFGSSSERLDRAQLELLLQLPDLADPDASDTVVEPKASVIRYRKERAPRLPENLPVIEEVIDPEPVKAAPQSADWLKPIYEQIRTGVMAGGYMQVDETPINYFEPGHGRTRQGYLWTGSRPGGDVFFRWETSRAGACLHNLIPVDFTGTLQCDGYSAYRAFANGRGGAIELAGCWAHVRRKFYEAMESSPRTAGWFVRQIQHLYRIETQLRAGRAGPRLRQAMRASQSRPVVKRIERALVKLKTSGRHLPQSLLGGAIDYALGQWRTLAVYLADGRVEIDNNLVENAIRPTAIGKKNWLFVGDAQAGERSAIIYTVIESCRRRGLDPYAYLRDVLTRLPHMTTRQIPEVTPQAWNKRQLPMQRLAS